MRANGIEIVHLLNIEHVNVEIAKPLLLGYMAATSLDMLSELTHSSASGQSKPTVVFDEEEGKLRHINSFTTSLL